MENNLWKILKNPFAIITPAQQLAWGVAATVANGLAIWAVRFYQQQTVVLGGQLLVSLLSVFLLPVLLALVERMQRRPVAMTSLFGGQLFAQLPKLVTSAASAWFYTLATPAAQADPTSFLGQIWSFSTAMAGGIATLGIAWSIVWGWIAYRHATAGQGWPSIVRYALCYVVALALLAMVLQLLRHGLHLAW